MDRNSPCFALYYSITDKTHTHNRPLNVNEVSVAGIYIENGGKKERIMILLNHLILNSWRLISFKNGTFAVYYLTLADLTETMLYSLFTFIPSFSLFKIWANKWLCVSDDVILPSVRFVLALVLNVLIFWAG